MDGLGGREGHAGRVLGVDLGVVPERGEGRGDEALREALVGDVRDIVGLEALVALGHVQVLAA